MPKDSYYIKLDSNSYDDPKVKVLRARHGNMWAFGGFIFIALKMRQESNHELEYSELTFEALSIDMGKTPEEVKQFVDEAVRVGLFQKNETHFHSDRLKRDMAFLQEKRDKASMAGKISADKRWGKTEPAPTPIIPATKSEPLVTDELRAEFKDIDIDEELKKFTLYWSEGKRKLQRPKTAFRNWLTKAREFKQEKQPAKPARQINDDGDNMEGMEVL